LATFEIDETFWRDFGLTPEALEEALAEEALAFADEAEVNPSKVISRGPGGHHYYDDVIGEDVVSWCIAYARQHPEDEYIQERVRRFQELNEELKKKGKHLLGYDESFFTGPEEI
jgi:hypothetical protein